MPHWDRQGMQGERTHPAQETFAHAQAETHSCTHTHTQQIHTTHKYTLACTFLVTDLNTHPVKWRSSFIQPGKVRSFRVQPPWSKNTHRGILLAGKWVTHCKGEMYVLGTEGHTPLCTNVTKTTEHKAWNRERESQKLFSFCFFTAEETRGKKRRERERKRK